MEFAAPSFEMDLYKQEWMGEVLEIWLDAVEDLGVFAMNIADLKSVGKRTKLEIQCMHRSTVFLEGQIAQRSIVVRFTSPGLMSFELHYKLVVDINDDSVHDKAVYYNDVLGRNIPSGNLHYGKWCKILGLDPD